MSLLRMMCCVRGNVGTPNAPPPTPFTGGCGIFVAAASFRLARTLSLPFRPGIGCLNIGNACGVYAVFSTLMLTKSRWICCALCDRRTRPPRSSAFRRKARWTRSWRRRRPPDWRGAKAPPRSCPGCPHAISSVSNTTKRRHPYPRGPSARHADEEVLVVGRETRVSPRRRLQIVKRLRFGRVATSTLAVSRPRTTEQRVSVLGERQGRDGLPGRVRRLDHRLVRLASTSYGFTLLARRKYQTDALL